MNAGRWIISDHAVQRFRERHYPDLDHERARSHLANQLKKASPLKSRTLNGDEQWSLAVGCVLVARFDVKLNKRVAVTILPTEEGAAERDLPQAALDFLEAQRASALSVPAKGPTPPRQQRQQELLVVGERVMAVRTGEIFEVVALGKTELGQPSCALKHVRTEQIHVRGAVSLAARDSLGRALYVRVSPLAKETKT